MLYGEKQDGARSIRPSLMPDNPIAHWRTGGAEPTKLPRGRHHLTREEVAASQKGRIMRAALEELGEKGAGPMTMAEVAKRAGVSKKAFYEHFEGLEPCVVEAMQTLNVVAGSEMARAAGEADSSEPFARVRTVVAELLDSAAGEPVLTSALLAPGFGLQRPDAPAWRFYHEVRSKMLMAWYDDERNRTPDLPETTFLLGSAAFTAFESTILISLIEGTQEDLPARTDEITNMIVGILSNGWAQYPPAK